MKYFMSVLIALSGLMLSGHALADAECAFKWDIHKEHALFTGSPKPTSAAAPPAPPRARSLAPLCGGKLAPADSVKYDVPPGKKMLTDGTFGGSLMFKVP